MKNNKDIIDFTRKVIDHIEDLDNWVDGHLKEIKDYSDTASDIVGPIKSFVSVVRFIKTRKFKSFLNSYGRKIKNNKGVIDDKFAEKLKKHLEKKRNLNLIYESIDSAVQSNSIYSASCIGYLCGSIVANLHESSNKILILINAFKNLNDFELYSSALILEKIKDWTRIQNLEELNVHSIGTISEYTIAKLKNLQIVESAKLQKTIHGLYDQQSNFQLSEITEEFWDIIKNSGVHVLMKNDFT